MTIKVSLIHPSGSRFQAGKDTATLPTIAHEIGKLSEQVLNEESETQA